MCALEPVHDSFCAPVSLRREVAGLLTYYVYAPVPALRRAGRSRSASLCDGATPERRTARRVAARLVARYNKPIPLRGPLGQRSGGPSKASRRSSQIVNRFLGVWSSLKGCSHYCSLKSDDQDQPLCMVVCRVQ